MDFLYNVSTLFYLLFFLAIVVVIGFLITWLIGKIVKSNTTKKVGKRGSLISGIVMIACLLLAGITNAGYNQIATKQNERFASYASKYEKLYLKTATKAEDLGNAEQKDWSDAIDNSDDVDDFDPDETIAKSMADNVNDVEDINTDMHKMKGYVKGMKDNETYTHSFDKYQKSYTELKKLTNLVTSPSGSYNSFTDNFGKYDDSTASAYKDLNFKNKLATKLK